MDIITIVSVVLSFVALLAAFVLEGGTLSALLQPTAALIVFGGTFGAIGVSFKGKTLKMVPQLLKRAFQNKKEDRKQILDTLLELSTITKKDGLLALEKEISTGNYHPLICTSLQLIIDSADEETLHNILETRITNLEERNERGIAIFEAAGGFGPTMGVIGTVMGLVHVLGDLSNPGELGAKIAVAFIATLYGVGSANLLWLPIANKLKEINVDEINTQNMIMEGMIMLRNGSNREFMKEELKGYLEDEEQE